MMKQFLRYAAVVVGALSFVSCENAEKLPDGRDSESTAGDNRITDPGSGGTEKCGGDADCNGPLLVSGTIVHKRGVPHTNDNDFVFTAESHARVRLYYSSGADAPSETVKEIRFSHLKKLPLVFAIPGDPAVVFQRQGDYGLSVEVHSKAGDESAVGDLINEMLIGVSGQTDELTVAVTGFEACGSEGSGGFCTGKGAAEGNQIP